MQLSSYSATRGYDLAILEATVRLKACRKDVCITAEPHNWGPASGLAGYADDGANQALAVQRPRATLVSSREGIIAPKKFYLWRGLVGIGVRREFSLRNSV